MQRLCPSLTVKQRALPPFFSLLSLADKVQVCMRVARTCCWNQTLCATAGASTFSGFWCAAGSLGCPRSCSMKPLFYGVKTKLPCPIIILPASRLTEERKEQASRLQPFRENPKMTKKLFNMMRIPFHFNEMWTHLLRACFGSVQSIFMALSASAHSGSPSTRPCCTCNSIFQLQVSRA